MQGCKGKVNKMKKIVNILVTLCAFAAAAFFFALAGGNFVQMFWGPTPLMDGTDYAEMEGKYIGFYAAHPVASYKEEYYSGDPSRVSKYGFVLYDRELQTFLYVVVPEQNRYDFEGLMRDLRMSETSERKPVAVEGTVKRMDADKVKHALKALEDRRTPDERLEAVWDELVQTQKDWYMIEYGAVAGIAKMDIWWCILAASLSLLIFVRRLVGMFTGGKEQETELSGAFENRLEQFFAIQRARIMEWCKYVRNRSENSVYLCVLCVTVGLIVIGFLAKYPPQGVLVRHFPMGVFFGEVFAVFSWRLIKSRSNWKKMLKNIRKDIEKAFPSAGAQDEFAGDYLDSCQEWGYDGVQRDALAYGVLGDRFWTSISGTGNVTIIDTSRLSRMDTFVDSGSVRYGKYRGRYIYYTVKFFLKDDQGMVYERNCLFPSQNAMDEFAQLAKRKAGDRIEIIEK